MFQYVQALLLRGPGLIIRMLHLRRLLPLFGTLTACPQGSYLPDADIDTVGTSTGPTSQPATSPDPTTETGEPPSCNMNGSCEEGESPQSCPGDCENCGNGIVDDGEVCDDGANNSSDNAYHDGDVVTAPCNSSCTGQAPFCGDGICQSGPENTVVCPGDGCVAACGNGALEGGEACDDGNLPTPTPASTLASQPHVATASFRTASRPATTPME